MPSLFRGSPFSVTASGTAVATATQAAVTGVTFYVTDIGISTQSTVATIGTFAVIAGASTVLWQGIFGTSTVIPYEKSFSTPLSGGLGNAVKITANGTASTFVNMSGVASGQ